MQDGPEATINLSLKKRMLDQVRVYVMDVATEDEITAAIVPTGMELPNEGDIFSIDRFTSTGTVDDGNFDLTSISDSDPKRYEVAYRRLNYDHVDLDLDDTDAESAVYLNAYIWVEESPLDTDE